VSPAIIAQAYEAACLAELEALKPGNVHVFAAGHRMSVEDFRRSAAVSAPHLAEPGARVGKRVSAAIRATIEAVGQNTNLGIVLLCAPIAAAAERGGEIRVELDEVLGTLTVEDARQVYAAIRLANPAGLGQAAQHDVSAEPEVDLRTAMGEAADYDRIARAYVSSFDDLFAVGIPALNEARSRRLAEPWTTTAVYLAYLAAFPDSHILRKFGAETAEAVRLQAAILVGTVQRTPDDVREFLDFDLSLKSRGLNPGTTADFTVATLFLDKLLSGRS
jgi:triphosphoribosyl-dephospho-CoA synthase